VSDNATDQLKFSSDGELEQSTDEEQPTDNLKDDGDPMGRFQSKAGYSIFNLASYLQKCVRRSDQEGAAFAAFELTRSGYSKMYWSRILCISVEDVSFEENVTSQVKSLYRLATGRVEAVDDWGANNERGRVCAIRAALTCAQAESSRLPDYMHNTFERIADERVTAAEEGRAPKYEFPAGDLNPGGDHDAIFDMHTSAGSSKNRGYEHFLVHSSRTDSMADMEARFKRINMELVADADDTTAEFTGTEFDHALSTVDPDDPWEEPNLEQETLDPE